MISNVQRFVIGTLVVLLIGAAGRLVFQHIELLDTRLDLKTEIAERKAETDARINLANRYAGQLAAVQRNHEVEQTKALNEFAQERDRLAAARRDDADRADRLQRGAEDRATRYRALAEAGPADCRVLADRSITLDQQLTAGVPVVDALRRDLERRDSEVMVLRRIILNDRAAVEAAQPAN